MHLQVRLQTSDKSQSELWRKKKKTVCVETSWDETSASTIFKKIYLALILYSKKSFKNLTVMDEYDTKVCWHVNKSVVDLQFEGL